MGEYIGTFKLQPTYDGRGSFRGKAVKDGRQIDGAVCEPVCRKAFAVGKP